MPSRMPRASGTTIRSGRLGGVEFIGSTTSNSEWQVGRFRVYRACEFGVYTEFGVASRAVLGCIGCTNSEWQAGRVGFRVYEFGMAGWILQCSAPVKTMIPHPEPLRP